MFQLLEHLQLLFNGVVGCPAMGTELAPLQSSLVHGLDGIEALSLHVLAETYSAERTFPELPLQLVVIDARLLLLAFLVFWGRNAALLHCRYSLLSRLRAHYRVQLEVVLR